MTRKKETNPRWRTVRNLAGRIPACLRNLAGRIPACLFVCSLLAAPAGAQRQWTLDECVKYATEHSTEMRYKSLELEISKNDLNTAQNDWMPVVSVALNQQFGFGNALASTGMLPYSNDNTNADLSLTGGSVGVAMPLFDGFLIRSRRRSAHWQVEQATASLAYMRKTLDIRVATYYLQVLYEQGMADVAQAQTETSRQLFEMTRALVDEGRIPMSEQADAEAQLSADEYQLTECRGRVRTALLSLAQLLNLDSTDDFDVAPLNDSLPPSPPGTVAADLYASVAETYPSILAGKAQVEKNRHAITAVRAAYYPHLTLSASFFTYYLNFFKHQPGMSEIAWNRIDNWMGYNFSYLFPNLYKFPRQKHFRRQLWDNGSMLLGLHLSMPLFDHFRTRNGIRKAKLLMAVSQLSLDDSRQQLRKEIDQAVLNAQNAAERLGASRKSEQAASVAFTFERDKFEAGRSTFYDLTLASQRLRNARENVVQAKYELLIRRKILDTYAQ